MIYQARTESNEMFIAMYETEEPKYKQFVGSPFADANFIDAMEKWQSSKREYKVRDEDKNDISHHMWSAWVNTQSGPPYDINLFHSDFAKGIDCTFLKDRLKLKGRRKIKEKEHVFEWTLLPLEDKKENEAVEFAEWTVINHYHSERVIKSTGEDFVRWTKGYQLPSKRVYVSTSELYQIFNNPNKPY